MTFMQQHFIINPAVKGGVWTEEFVLKTEKTDAVVLRDLEEDFATKVK